MATHRLPLLINHSPILPQRKVYKVAQNHNHRPTLSLYPHVSSQSTQSLNSSLLRQRSPSIACASELVDPLHQNSAIIEERRQWDSITSTLTTASNVPFLFIQMPQIILNASNLMAGNKAALLAIPWLSMFSGLLGNVTLLTYFAKKRETGAIAVQTLGSLSTFAVLSQLAMADAMPLNVFVATSVVVAIGLVLPFLNYFGKLNSAVWKFWEDAITIVGMSALPQAMWSTFVPLLPDTSLPGVVSAIVAVFAVVLARRGKLNDQWVSFVGAISGWTATLLFMWMPVAQLWTNFLNPENIKGLSALTMLLAMIGNGLMIPRAFFIGDAMWLTGCTWSTMLYGYANIMCLYVYKCIGKGFFVSSSLGLVAWLTLIIWKNQRLDTTPLNDEPMRLF